MSARGTRLILTALLGLAGACSREAAVAEPAQPIGPVVTVAEAAVQSIQDTATTAGQVVPAASTDWTIYAPEPSLIAEMPKMVGDPVAAGDLLVRFEVGSLSQNFNVRQAALSDASAKVDSARAEVSRLTPLFERGLIPRNDLEHARADLSSAEAARATAEAYLEEARMMRDATRVTARFSGVVAEVWHVAGEFTAAQSTDPIMRVIDPARLEIQIELPINQALRVRESHPATVMTLAAGSFTATVTRRPVGVLVDTTTMPVRLTAPEVSALALNDMVQVQMVLDERPNATVVPVESVQQDGTSTWVMVVGPDSIARQRPVRVGLTSGGFAQIVEGLQPGEQVVVQGLTDVTDGTAVLVSR